MYSKEDLEKYEFFQGLDMEYVLDALTGAVSRGYIIGFANQLIEDKVPFAFSIVDLDNFKLINDNYGHLIGDECLKAITKSFIEYVGDKGLVGRYGGDELIIIYLGGLPTYEEIHGFYTNLYHDKKCVRKTYNFSQVRLFVTATTGSASYPYDATEFEDLFNKADKALYRGKQKGRNCYIVYVDEKHRDIDVHRRDNTYLPDMMQTVQRYISYEDDLKVNVQRLIDYVASALSIADALVISNDFVIESTLNPTPNDVKRPTMDDCKVLFDDSDFVVSNQLKNCKMKSPGLNRYMTANKTQAIMCFKICFNETKAYFLLMENRILRIWQEKEVALAIHVANIISFLFELKK